MNENKISTVKSNATDFVSKLQTFLDAINELDTQLDEVHAQPEKSDLYNALNAARTATMEKTVKFVTGFEYYLKYGVKDEEEV